MPKKKLDTSFIDWIDSQGVKNLAKTLEISPSAIKHWRLGNTMPGARHMKQIKRLSKGVVDYHNIIDGARVSITRTVR